MKAAIPDQPLHVAVALCGDIERAGWWGPGRTATWSDAVEAARVVAGAARAELEIRSDSLAPWHPGRCAALVLDGAVVGHAGELHPRVVATLGLPERTCAMELDLSSFAPPGPNAVNSAVCRSLLDDVAPILYAQCIPCHRAGGIAPFPLDDTELATLAGWVVQGTPEGDPRKAPALPAPAATVDAPDAVVDTGVTYTPAGAPGHEDDDYRCFVAPGPASAAAFLVGFEVVPGDARVVHHAIAYQPADDDAAAAARALDDAEEGPGYTCFGGPGVNAAPVALWAPGTGAVLLPTGTGLPLAADRPWVVQIHYNLAQGVFPDRTRVKVQLTQRPVRPAVFAAVVDRDLRLPPGLASVEATATTAQDPTAPYTVYGAAPHMHTLGRTMRVDVSNDAGPACLVDVDRWDFHWQNVWWYDQPIHVVGSRSISIRCGYDTTTRTDTVTWGEGTADEMCISYFYLVPDAVPAVPPTCDDTGNPLFGSCIDAFLTGCFEPDQGGTCTDTGGVVQWSDGSRTVRPGQHDTELPGFYRPGAANPCIGLATDSNGGTLSKGLAAIRYASGAHGGATITCPDRSTLTAGSAQVSNFNLCRGIECPP